MPIPADVLKLVQRFAEQRDHYLNSSYNETQLRREFLDPLFEALGWDVANRQGHAEAYKDVVHEDAIRVTGGERKAPDYSFRIGGTRKFFLEAKKPSINLKDDPSPALQLRRYAWSSKLPLSILSDFEEFAVYDCRIRPQASDKASVGRILYLKFDQYEAQWEEIASVFSREAVLKGGFDRWAGSTRKKRGTAEVDDAFLEDIESWRAELARNLALRNPKLSQRELNYAVQQTIDRIIFLRICEDRGIEPQGQLGGLVNGPHIYQRLKEVFVSADARYNSGLFHFRSERERSEAPDELTPSLKIDDKVLKEILGGLYYPESPYEFSVLPADILGQVYEQFLGKVIRLTSGHQAKVEEKPEVKKAGGVYYTPTYIVDYIVKQTVGQLVEGKTPKDVDALTVLDPACGSGSFLIGAYQFLLDWYRDQYQKAPDKHRKQLYQGPGGVWRLTTPERKRILLNNIYGVDIDAQAVEVTKLSLLLKVLEGESPESLQQELTVFRQRALPDLADNIKCGNSLIG
ncbi:MAG: DNA methyltransferase, partial [Gemmatimonadota bacterium]